MNLNLFFGIVYGVGLGISAFVSVQDDVGPLSALLDALDGRKVPWPTGPLAFIVYNHTIKLPVLISISNHLVVLRLLGSK